MGGCVRRRGRRRATGSSPSRVRWRGHQAAAAAGRSATCTGGMPPCAGARGPGSTCPSGSSFGPHGLRDAPTREAADHRREALTELGERHHPKAGAQRAPGLGPAGAGA